MADYTPRIFSEDFGSIPGTAADSNMVTGLQNMPQHHLLVAGLVIAAFVHAPTLCTPLGGSSCLQIVHRLSALWKWLQVKRHQGVVPAAVQR